MTTTTVYQGSIERPQPDQKIVLCHGVFDTLHPGHIAHLKEAASLGDVLVVSVTADEYVNKGPGRPIFPTQQRVEQVAALECVDYVVVSNHPTAREVLEAVRPTYFVKGADYDGGGILPEEGVTAQAVGAQVRFTSAPVDSSSRVGNRAYATYPESTEAWLAGFRERHDASEVLSALDAISGLNVLIVGEHIIDRYTFVDTLAKSPREHHLSVKQAETVNYPGGSVAVRRHLAGFVGKTHAITQREAIIKERFVESGERRKLFSVQQFPESMTIAPADWERLEHCGDYDLVVVTDYGHGLFTDGVRSTIQLGAKFLAVNCQTNSANYGFNPITRWVPDFACLDGPEYSLAIAHGWKPTSVPHVLVTKGKDGCNFGSDVPALAVSVVDRVGGGDALFALAAPLVAVGTDPEIAAFLGSCAAAMQVETLGNERAVNPTVLRKFVARLLA